MTVRLPKTKRKNTIVLLSIVTAIIGVRIFVFEICFVPTNSMIPTIQPGELAIYEKITFGNIYPRRLADIPVINLFTWITPLRKLDELIDWGYHRRQGKRLPRKDDIVLFHHPENKEILLVKRISKIIEKNKTITIDSDNYRQIEQMAKHENRKITRLRNRIFIDGEHVKSFTPSQNHYFMSGDNAGNSTDSRIFGYIPETYIVGKIGLILFSWDRDASGWQKIRWKRLFKTIR